MASEPVAGPHGGTVAKAFGRMEKTVPLTRFAIRRRKLEPTDVLIDIAYCGICRTDLHLLDNDWNISKYPLVPGHEICGHVKEVGSQVKNLKAGQAVGVGFFVDCCGKCSQCKSDSEQYCENGITITFNSESPRDGGATTFGGFSSQIVVKEDFVVPVPEGYPLDKVGCLFCAGITVYSPLYRCHVKQGTRVGIAGLGGLGHMAVQLAKAMGAEVWVISRNDSKKEQAMKLGATGFADCSKVNEKYDELKLDLILDLISAKHDINRFLPMLKHGGTLCMIGLPREDVHFNSLALALGGKRIIGSLVGSIAETRDLLKLCAEKHIYPDVTEIPIDQVNDALEKLRHGEIANRFVIKMDTL